MSYSQTWLEDTSSIRGILVEVSISTGGGSALLLYLSSMPYITTSADVTFDPVIANSVQFGETLSLDGSASISYGDIEVYNHNGVYDSWLDPSQYNWVNGTVKVYYGDPKWVCANLAAVRTTFKLVFEGSIEDIDSKSRSYLNIKLRDKAERLNTAITEQTVGIRAEWPDPATQPNIDQVVPLVFGEVFNYEPVLLDPNNLVYQFNQGASERLIEVRDNGVPVYTDYDSGTDLTDGLVSLNLTTSTFQLRYQPAGTITVSVQGVKQSVNLSTGALEATYSNNIAKIIALIVTQYGLSTRRLSASELDLANFSAFSTAVTYPVGYLVTDRENVLDVCQMIAGSVGAQLYLNRDGKLQILRAGVTTGDTSVTITDNDILFDSLEMSEKVPVVASVNLNYAKNWSVQSNLQTGIPDAAKKSFSTEWYNAIYTDGTAQSKYKLEKVTNPKDTALITRAAAEAEATRLVNYYKQPRIKYKFTGTASLISLKLGQPVVLLHSRFGLYNSGSGKSGQVVGLSVDWLKGTVEVEVLV